jgi:hypothetical protein
LGATWERSWFQALAEVILAALGLEHVPNTQVVQPGLVTVPEAVRRQPPPKRQPVRESRRIAWLTFTARAALPRHLVVDERAVLA